MKSKKVNEILKVFMEPRQFHEEVWMMKPKYNNFEIVIACSYGKCWKEAEKQIETHNAEIYE